MVTNAGHGFLSSVKIFSFLTSDLCCSSWGLKVATVQQSTIFGSTIIENKEVAHHSLSTRFNYDQVFGTVINRFVCQSAINHPITVYGDGKQKTGLISLNNAVNNFLRLSQTNIINGQHLIEHNYTHKFSIMDIANILMKIKKVKINLIENPRIEKISLLEKKFEFSDLLDVKLKSKTTFIEDIKDLLDFVVLYKDNIDEDIIDPTVNWKK